VRTGHLSAQRWKLAGLACVGGLAAFSVLSSVVEDNSAFGSSPAQRVAVRRQGGGVTVWAWPGSQSTEASGDPAAPFTPGTPAAPFTPDKPAGSFVTGKPSAADAQLGSTVPAAPRVPVKPGVGGFPPKQPTPPDPGRGV